MEFDQNTDDINNLFRTDNAIVLFSRSQAKFSIETLDINNQSTIAEHIVLW